MATIVTGLFEGYILHNEIEVYVKGDYDAFIETRLLRITWSVPNYEPMTGFLQLINGNWQFGTIGLQGFIRLNNEYSEQIKLLVVTVFLGRSPDSREYIEMLSDNVDGVTI